MAFTHQIRNQRDSFARRISGMFQRRAQDHDLNSTRATTTFEVPLFLSPARYEPPHAEAADTYNHCIHSRSSAQSLTESAGYDAEHASPHAFPASSRYSSSTTSPVLRQAPVLPQQEPHPPVSDISEMTTSSSSPSKTVRRHRRRRHRYPVKAQMQALTRLSAAFGATLLVTLITYLVLAVTNTAGGIMFHVLMILLVLALTGIFAHSAIRLFLLSRKPQDRRTRRQRTDRWHGHDRQPNGMYFGEIHHNAGEECDEVATEKPIRIIMADDEESALDHSAEHPVLKQPPPVYGNFRSSKRINPNLVHWQQVPPSPLTPTYDEAMSDVHRVVGYRPPSYVASESGATHIVEQGRRDVDRALKNIHPLDRHNMI